MDLPISAPFQRHADGNSTIPRTSPPGSSTSSPQTMIPPPPNPFAIAPASRAPGLSAPLAQVGSRSPASYNGTLYSRSYGTSSSSPGAPSVTVPDAQPNDPANLTTTGISAAHMSTSNFSAQKRAYRQRRKDPSCDACRERKVKCDATETTACSECSSRNHRCQFTKETNRRMSSIKQMQDLQSQLAEVKQENTTLRTKLSDRDAMDIDGPNTTTLSPEVKLFVRSTQQRVKAPVMKNFEHIRKNIRIHSRDIFDVPGIGRGEAAQTITTSELPDMPPRADFARISRSYVDSIHEAFPVLHWPTFQHEVDQIYTERSFQGMSREWIGLFFAVMACGTLQVPKGQDQGHTYFDISTTAFTPSPEHFNMTHAKSALLLSIFATESNMRSSGSTWLALAVRIAQLIGLNSEVHPLPVVEGEVRRRLWWSIYVWDRVTSLGTNCPMLIHEEDCDISLPSSVEDRYIQPQGFVRPRATQTAFTGFIAVIQVARLFWPLYQAMRSSIITAETLQSYEEKFYARLLLLPETYQSGSDSSLEPAALSPLLTLQYARFTLFRRNISPVCAQPERMEALRRCVAVAQDTAKYISRTLQTSPMLPDPETAWGAKVTQIASNMICIHLWRCMLVLCFHAEYDAALMCLRLSSYIGDTRKINTACAKNLTFFLDRLGERLRSGHHKLDSDEEILAYVSGDMQGVLEPSWAWTDSDFALTQTSPRSSPRGSIPVPALDEPMQGTSLPLRPNPGSPEVGLKEWSGWGRIEHTIHQLMDEHHARPVKPPPYYSRTQNPSKRIQLAPDASVSPPRTAPAPPPTPSSASRISIANII